MHKQRLTGLILSALGLLSVLVLPLVSAFIVSFNGITVITQELVPMNIKICIISAAVSYAIALTFTILADRSTPLPSTNKLIFMITSLGASGAAIAGMVIYSSAKNAALSGEEVGSIAEGFNAIGAAAMGFSIGAYLAVGCGIASLIVAIVMGTPSQTSPAAHTYAEGSNNNGSQTKNDNHSEEDPE